MPRILLVNRVFPPTPGATGQLVWELAGDLAHRGHQVTVLAGEAAGTREPDTALPRGVTVLRYGRGGQKRTSVPGKALAYAVQYPSLAWRLHRMPPMDVWITMTDPPLQSVVAAWMRPAATRLIHWAQDVYPDVAEELGVIDRSGFTARVCRHQAIRSLRRHDGVVTVGRCMADRLRLRDPQGPVPEVIPNWAPLPAPRSDDNTRRDRFRSSLFPSSRRSENTLLVMYSGNFGRAHPFEAIAEAVRLTAAMDPGVLWAFIGDGPKYAWMRQAVGGLSNTAFLPPQPWSELRATLSSADLHLASMETFLAGTVVPSKTYGALAVGRPCLLIGPAQGEAARLLVESGAGTVMENPSGQRLAEEIRRLRIDTQAWTAMKQAAAAAIPLVSRERCLDRWADFINRTLIA